MSVVKQLMNPIDFYSIFFLYTNEVNGYQLSGYPYSSKYLLVFNKRKKLHVLNKF